MNKRLSISAVILLQALVLPACLAANEISGAAYASDGDTLKISGHKFRIHGIDTPESKQNCRDNAGKTWACGTAASKEMRAIIAGKTVRCEIHTKDRYGRFIARCFAGDVDLGQHMVETGLAIAYRRYSKDYVGAENKAKHAKLGVWSGEFVPPWEWRRGTRFE